MVVILILVIFGIIIVPRLPAIKQWIRVSKCPKCGHWFCLELQSFYATDQVVGRDSKNSVIGGLFRFIGLDIIGSVKTKDQPFIREWGEAHYICRSCGKYVSVQNVRRDKR
jgi:ribosomal protein L32